MNPGNASAKRFQYPPRPVLPVPGTLHPVRSEVALWHQGRLRLLAQVRQATPTSHDMYVHLPRGGREVAHSFHASGDFHTKFLEGGAERFRLPHDRVVGGARRRVQSAPRHAQAVSGHAMIGLRDVDFPFLATCAFRPEGVLAWDDRVDAALLSFHELGADVSSMPFPSNAMAVLPVQAAPMKLYAILNHGSVTDFYDGQARRLELPAFDEPPRPAFIQLAPEELWPCRSWPDDAADSMTIALEDGPLPAGLKEAWLDLPLRRGTCMDDTPRWQAALQRQESAGA